MDLSTDPNNPSIARLWDEEFRPIIESTPSDDGSYAEVRDWFKEIGRYHGFVGQDFTGADRIIMTGRNLDTASYVKIHDYFVCIARSDQVLYQYASEIARDAWQALLLKKLLDHLEESM